MSSVGRTCSNPLVGLDMEWPQLSGSDTELSGQPRISLEQPIRGVTPDNGLGQIQIQLDFGSWIQLDLDVDGYGHPLGS